jgi:hypothetical protein
VPTRADEAYIRVRVTEDVNPDGYVGVYLPTGTRLDVRASDLLRFNPETASMAVVDDGRNGPLTLPVPACGPA